eukprot:COSAG02_NODE_4364_length_5447_cov_19.656694_4_plen_71_part_00
MLAIAVVASLVVVVHGHGAVVNPPYAMQLAYNAPPAVPSSRRQRVCRGAVLVTPDCSSSNGVCLAGGLVL